MWAAKRYDLKMFCVVSGFCSWTPLKRMSGYPSFYVTLWRKAYFKVASTCTTQLGSISELGVFLEEKVDKCKDILRSRMVTHHECWVSHGLDRRWFHKRKQLYHFSFDDLLDQLFCLSWMLITLTRLKQLWPVTGTVLRPLWPPPWFVLWRNARSCVRFQIEIDTKTSLGTMIGTQFSEASEWTAHHYIKVICWDLFWRMLLQSYIDAKCYLLSYACVTVSAVKTSHIHTCRSTELLSWKPALGCL